MQKLNEGFDLVLTDLKMEDMDGIEVLELVKERSPETAVIVITGYAALDSAIEAIRRQQAVDEMVSTTVSGNLRDMSLTSIVQMTCTDMKSAKLVLRQPNFMPDGEKREGVIFFENGQIVHAAVGSLRGTEAVYELLDWDEGFFQMESNVVAPRQTISVPWTHLLLESTSGLDEQGQEGATLSRQLEADNHPPPDPGNGLADIERNEEADEEREVELLSLLSKLEQSLARLVARKDRDRPQFTLEMLADDVNKLLELYQNRFPDASTDSFLRESLVTVAKSYPTVRLVQTRKGCLDVSTLKRLLSNWSGGQQEREAVYTEVIEGLLYLLELMLTGTVREAIKSPAVVRRCREVYDVFLNDLEREVKGKL